MVEEKKRMRRSSKILLLLGVFSTLVGLAYWDEWQTNKEVTGKMQEHQMLSFQTAKVTKVVLKEDGKEVALERVGPQHWNLVQPSQRVADIEKVGRFLETLAQSSYQKVVTEQSSDWGQYGLSSASKQVLLYLEGKDEPLTLYVGDEAPVGYGAYFATNRDTRVFLASQYLRTATSRDSNEFSPK